MRTLNDYRKIKIKEKGADEPRLITVKDTNHWHAKDVRFIEKQVQLAKERKEVAVVLTHHGPSFQGTSDPQYLGRGTNTAFCTDLSHLMNPRVRVWGFGHTHWSCDELVKSTRVVSNQLGYLLMEHRNPGYRSECVVDIYRYPEDDL
eukprot:TRINITY_DN9220_c0_g1_i1.p1 TRINITY_DN9220_c0_g1~~TRINITY_DN9220_c0_g1_i1.p1  ORF type:complete len:147 (+),score=21.82 TRINITY_DN9220_c0_g1_i1:287-727(+)